MPLDAIAIHALAEELNTALPGARIDKIQQPERDVIILSVRGGFGNKKLLEIQQLQTQEILSLKSKLV